MKKNKIIASIFVCIFFYSCEEHLDNFAGAKIVFMQSWGTDKCKYQCTYKDGIGSNVIYFVDSCGKYKIDDIVRFQK